MWKRVFGSSKVKVILSIKNITINCNDWFTCLLVNYQELTKGRMEGYYYYYYFYYYYYMLFFGTLFNQDQWLD